MALDHLSALLEAAPLPTRPWGGCRARPRPIPRETPLVMETAEGSSGKLQGPHQTRAPRPCAVPRPISSNCLTLGRGHRVSPRVSLPLARAFGRLPAAVCAVSAAWAQSSPRVALRLQRGRGRADRQGCSGLVFTRSLAFDFCCVVAMAPGVGSQWE